MSRPLLLIALVACTKPHPAPVTDEPMGSDTASATTTSTSTSTASSSTANSSSTTTTTTTSQTTTTQPVLTSCPATYAEATAGSCALASVGKLACPYADGHCSCNEYRPCSGVAMVYDEARAHPTPAWSCVPKVRPDGCPGERPATGSSCAKAGQECAYASCGGDVLGCQGGAWTIARRIAPPPAAPHY